MTHHLAQLNIARLQHPLDAPETQGFVDALEPVNALADAAPGFVWRLQTDDGDATAIRLFDDDLTIVNLSVWESLDALKAFVYSGRHMDVMRRRRSWFERMGEAHLVLWWIPIGYEPNPEEAVQRLAMLRRNGPSPAAFTMRRVFDSPPTRSKLHDRRPVACIGEPDVSHENAPRGAQRRSPMNVVGRWSWVRRHP